MLAYDLYLKNKNYSYEFTGSTLIKKIFVLKKDNEEFDIKIDNTTLEQYGINEDNKNKFQSIFQMPEKNKAKLPYRITGSNSPKPYIELEGKFESKKNVSRFIVSFKGKNADASEPSKFSSELVIYNNNESKDHNLRYNEDIKAENALKLKLNKIDYCVENNISIYDLYNQSSIINNDSLESETFKKIIKEFYTFIKNKWIDEMHNPKEKMIGLKFSLVILPSEKDIYYLPKTINEEDIENITTDSFGNETSGFPKETTQTAKFLSFDDPAFSVNCKIKEDFYQNLSIGKKSFKSINIPNESVFNISGLNWIFTDFDDPSYIFTQTRKGIYHQLFSNYNTLKQRAGDSYNKQSCLKIICFEKNQAKLEILLDDNLTMQSMRKIFQRIGNYESQTEIPFNALEILIEKGNGTKVIWTMYINAIQSILHEKTMDRSLILSFFNKKIRSEIFGWIKRPENNFEISDFFEKSEFCIKILTTGDSDISIMNQNEEYAYKLGLIAGRYINFKKYANEDSNSLKDILTYSKYDREKLRNVLKRVGLGVNISDSNESNMKNMLDFMKQNCPSTEISDEDANKDFSYFFYKGAFHELC